MADAEGGGSGPAFLHTRVTTRRQPREPQVQGPGAGSASQKGGLESLGILYPARLPETRTAKVPACCSRSRRLE